MRRPVAFVSLAAGAAVLASLGCSDTVSSGSRAVVSYASEAARPSCDAGLYLEVAYAIAERSFSVCTDGVWLAVTTGAAAS